MAYVIIIHFGAVFYLDEINTIMVCIRNSEILQQERNRGRAPWIFNRTIFLLGYCWQKKFDHHAPLSPDSLNHCLLGWPRDSGTLDQIVLRIMIHETVFPLLHLPRAWNWWWITREGHELCLQWVSSRSGPWFDCQQFTWEAILGSLARGGRKPCAGCIPKQVTPGGTLASSLTKNHQSWEYFWVDSPEEGGSWGIYPPNPIWICPMITFRGIKPLVLPSWPQCQLREITQRQSLKHLRTNVIGMYQKSECWGYRRGPRASTIISRIRECYPIWQQLYRCD